MPASRDSEFVKVPDGEWNSVSAEEAAFMQAAAVNPQDDTVRHAFADWCDEHDQPERSAFIKIQLQMAKYGPLAHGLRDGCRCRQCVGFRRLTKIVTPELRKRWSWGVDPYAQRVFFFRGMVEAISMHAHVYDTKGVAAVTAQPLKRIYLTNKAGRIIPVERQPGPDPLFGWMRRDIAEFHMTASMVEIPNRIWDLLPPPEVIDGDGKYYPNFEDTGNHELPNVALAIAAVRAARIAAGLSDEPTGFDYLEGPKKGSVGNTRTNGACNECGRVRTCTYVVDPYQEELSKPPHQPVWMCDQCYTNALDSI